MLDANVALRMTTIEGKSITRASAYFSKLPSPEPAQQLEIGGCTFTEFSGATPSDDDPPRAGAITVGKAGGTSLTLTPSPLTGYYEDAASESALFGPGDSIDFSAQGDGVAAFSGSVLAPGALTVTQPAKPAEAQPLVIDRSKPFEVTWTPGPAGAVANLLLLADAPTPGHSFAARCPVDLSVGKATFAPEGLAIMPAGEGSIRFTAIQKSVVSAGDASVELLVAVGATTQDGAQTMHLMPARFELAAEARRPSGGRRRAPCRNGAAPLAIEGGPTGCGAFRPSCMKGCASCRVCRKRPAGALLPRRRRCPGGAS